jgi:RimJ/RimL family protein N-acetyltransferase
MYDFQMMSRDSLDQIARGLSPRMDGLTVETGALPPQPVARRIVAALANGTLPEWCMSYMVIERDTRRVLACCNFKGNPVHRSVEIGYGVSSLHWGKGVGIAAAMFLLDMARKSRRVDVVVANISANNPASQKVASKLGFTNTGRVVESGGEKLVQWTLRIAG